MAGKLEGKRILIVDDDQDIRSAMEATLGETGAEITTACDGDQALTVNSKIDPDLVVLDMGLPKRSGYLVLGGLKPNGKAGERPYVVVVTGNAGKRHEVYARSLGVDDYLNKPFRMERLVNSVEQLLGS